MTPSGELREAAALLRSRAGKATPGPWTAGEPWQITGNPDPVQTVTAVGEHHQHVDVAGYRVQTEDYGDDGGIDPGDAEWIAMMSPAVAEPLAAMFDHAADVADRMDRHSPGGQCREDQYVHSVVCALAVSRSITKAQEAP